MKTSRVVAAVFVAASGYAAVRAGGRRVDAAADAAEGARPLSRAQAQDSPSAPPDIILVTVDTLRADHLFAYGYFRTTSPNLDSLATEATLFERTYAPMATTFPSHLSLLTGVYPSEHGYLSNTRLIESSFSPTAKLRTVTQMLKDAGYATAAFVSAAPVRDSTGLGAGFDTYDQPEKDDWQLAGQRRADATSEAFLTWLATAPRRPFFAWIHYFDPHWPYDPPALHPRMFSTTDKLREWVTQRQATSNFPDKWKTRDVLDIHNRYDAEIRFMDEHFGRLVAALRARGILDHSVLVVTADHGEGLGQHQWPAHGDLHEEQMHVPLLIRWPAALKRAPARVPTLTSLVDVFPTVLAGIQSPAAKALLAQASGADVLAADFRRDGVFAERTDHSEGWPSGRRFAFTEDRWRYYHLTEHPEELFDLKADPHELRNVAGEQPEIAARMKARILQMLEGFEPRAKMFGEGRPERRSTPDERMRGELRGLGYVEDKPQAPEDEAPRRR